MKNVFIAAFVLCSGLAFSQTVPQSNSRQAKPNGTLIQGQHSAFLIKAQPNTVAVSNKRAGNGKAVSQPVEATNEKATNTPVSNDRPKR